MLQRPKSRKKGNTHFRLFTTTAQTQKVTAKKNTHDVWGHAYFFFGLSMKVFFAQPNIIFVIVWKIYKAKTKLPIITRSFLCGFHLKHFWFITIGFFLWLGRHNTKFPNEKTGKGTKETSTPRHFPFPFLEENHSTFLCFLKILRKEGRTLGGAQSEEEGDSVENVQRRQRQEQCPKPEKHKGRLTGASFPDKVWHGCKTNYLQNNADSKDVVKLLRR